jgi:hypothetical protein
LTNVKTGNDEQPLMSEGGYCLTQEEYDKLKEEKEAAERAAWEEANPSEKCEATPIPVTSD